LYATPYYPVSWQFIPSMSGLGAVSAQTNQAVSQTGALVGAAAGASLALAGATALIPIVGPAIAAVTVAIELILNSGCGQTCIVAAQDANAQEQLLQQNLAAYFGTPAPRTQSQQTAALANFDAIWAQLVAECNVPSLASAGQRCITDRQRGACTWKQTVPPIYPNSPQVGDCWNWFNGYRDPISLDVVAADSASGAVDSLFSGGSSSTTTLLLLAALAVGLVVLL
jgi:hypothetical protein